MQLYETYKGVDEKLSTLLRQIKRFLEGGTFFSIDCIKNYELIRELCAYGKDLIVLHSDGTVAENVRKRVREMVEQYENVNK